MKKKLLIIALILVIASIILIVYRGNIFGFVPATTNSTSTLNEPKIPSSSAQPAASQSTIIFDFDRGTPTVLEGQSTPFSQTSGGVIASFSSNSDPSGFSIQSYKSTFYTLIQFSNRYLYDNKITRDILYIAFSQPVIKINFTFATVEYEGPGHLETPSTIKLTAYMNSIRTTPISSVLANGNFSSSSFPQGTISFESISKPFNIVKIEMLYQINGGTDFLIDNVVVLIEF